MLIVVGTLSKKILHLITKIFILCTGIFAFFVIYLIVSEIVYAYTNVQSKILFNLLSLLGFILTTVIFIFLIKVFKIKGSKKLLICILVTSFFIDQYVTLVLTPASSIIPNKVLLGHHILENADYDGYCDIKTQFDKAKSFMKNDVDTDSVHIYYTGNSFITSTARFIPIYGGTYTHQGNIYLISNKANCPNVAVLVHELTHVWQLQNNTIRGFAQIKSDIYGSWKYLTNRKQLYDYGGTDGLKKAKERGQSFNDFNHEQQANITAAYYIYKSYNADFYIDEQQILLEYFLEPEFNFD